MNRPRATFALLLLLAAVARPAVAFEPPRPSVQQALEAGHMAVVARVQALRETARKPTHSSARATLVVLKCLYGRACQRRNTLQMGFTPETVQDGELGVNFLLGREYLLVFNQPPAQGLVFGTRWPRHMDVAFLLRTPLQPLQALDPATDSITLENVWGGPPQVVDSAALEAWAAQRTRALGPLGR